MSWSFTTFRHHRKKSNGSYQIKIKVRNTSTLFQRDFPIEFFDNGKKIKLSLAKEEWENPSKAVNKLIKKSLFWYEEIIKTIEEKKWALNTKVIQKLYAQKPYEFVEEPDNEKIKALLSFDTPKDMIENYSQEKLIGIANFVDDLGIKNEDNEIFQEDELASIYLYSEVEKTKKDDLEKASKIKDNLARCDAQYEIIDYANFSKIIDVFGYYWTLKKKNGGRFLKRFDNKIVLRLAQYIFATNASNNIQDLDSKWLTDYFIYLRDVGYVDTRKIRNYTPLELYSFKDIILQSLNNCKPYSDSSFKDQIKKFKCYFNNLKINTDFLDSLTKIDVDEYSFDSLKHEGAYYSEIKTQKDHYVNVEELKRMFDYKSINPDLNLTRDIFFIQTFTSGNRSIRKDKIKTKSIKGKTYFDVSHSKTRSTNTSGMFEYLREIMDRHNGELPTPDIDPKVYNENLKLIAKELNLNRNIEFIKNKVNSTNSEIILKPLYECISQYFSRHTLVNYLLDGGASDDEIIKITGHTNTKILAHYKKNVTVEDKQKIIDRADKKNKEL